MFKILVTTQIKHASSNGCGVSVHTLVIEFGTREEAEAAHAIIERSDMKGYTDEHYRSSLRLYNHMREEK